MGPGVLNGIWVSWGELVGEGNGLDVGTGPGVAFGSGVNPGKDTLLVLGVFVDLKARNEIKIPAVRAVNNRITYRDIGFFAFFTSRLLYQKFLRHEN